MSQPEILPVAKRSPSCVAILRLVHERSRDEDLIAGVSTVARAFVS